MLRQFKEDDQQLREGQAEIISSSSAGKLGPKRSYDKDSDEDNSTCKGSIQDIKILTKTLANIKYIPTTEETYLIKYDNKKVFNGSDLDVGNDTCSEDDNDNERKK